jgi:hypothetical protein
MRNRPFIINRHYKNMTIKKVNGGCDGGARHFPRPVHGGGRLVVVTMWRKGAKWDNMEEIFYSK